MSDSNALSRPLGRDVPLPGGDVVDTPQQRQTLPGGAPGGGGNAPAPPPQQGGQYMSFEDSRKTLLQQHNRNKAAFEATGKALKQLDTIRKGLEHLADKQDVVTMEDVVEEAGKLVAHGIDPVALAGVLADAPQEGGGEALGGWVASHAQTAAGAEQQLMAQHNLLRHQVGMSAIHMMMADANGQTALGSMGRGSTGNDLGTAASPELGDQPDSSPGNALAMGQRFMRPQ